MKIEVERNAYVRFDKLHMGDVFLYQDAPYVKCSYRTKENCIKIGYNDNIRTSLFDATEVVKATKVVVGVK